MLHRLAFALLLTNGPAALAAKCTPPVFMQLADLSKAPGDVNGTGKGANANDAMKDARRAIASKIVRPRLAEILSLPFTKDSVNRKVYTKDDLLKGTILAVALTIKDPRRLANEVVCNVTYVALAAPLKGMLADLKNDAELGDEINAALTGKIEVLEARRQSSDASSFKDEFRAPEETIARLKQTAASLTEGDVMADVSRRALLRKADHLIAALDEVKPIPWSDLRTKKAKTVFAEALEHEKFVAAARELKQRDFVAAFEILNGRASAGDDDAQFLVGFMYSEALGVKRDYSEALGWLKRAAAQNHRLAKALIGVLIYSGKGAKPNPTEAFRWLDVVQSDGWTCEIELKSCKK